MQEDLMPEEVEALLRKRYSNSKGKSFFEVLFRDYKKFKEKYWSPNTKNKNGVIILICLMAVGLLVSSFFSSDKILFSSEVPTINNKLDYEINTLKDEDELIKSKASQRKLDYAMKVLKGADELFKSEAKKSIEERVIVEGPKKKTIPFPVITKAKIYSNFNDNFIKNRDCKNIRSSRVTFNFEIAVNESGGANQVKYLGNRENLSRSNKKLLDMTKEALYQTKYTPALSDGKGIKSVIRQPITLSRGVCQ